MLISLYFSKLHILVLVYVVVEFAKRMMKEQYYATKTKENKELTENNVYFSYIDFYCIFS